MMKQSEKQEMISLFNSICQFIGFGDIENMPVIMADQTVLEKVFSIADPIGETIEKQFPYLPNKEKQRMWIDKVRMKLQAL